MKMDNISKIKTVFLQIKYDTIQGVVCNRKKFLVLTIFCIVICLFCYKEIEVLIDMGYISSTPGVLEFILYFAGGMREYIPESNLPFQVPFAWLSVNLLLAYIIGDYVTKDLYNIGIQMILRSSHKYIWILGKIIYSIISTLLVYILQFIVCYFFGGCLGNVELEVLDDIWELFYGINPSLYSNFEIVAGLIVLPVFTSIVISVIQIFLTLYIKPVYSFIVVSIYLITSAYWKSYIFIGNYSMFLRNDQICENGMVQTTCFTNLLCILLSAIVLIILIFSKYDIIEKR